MLSFVKFKLHLAKNSFRIVRLDIRYFVFNSKNEINLNKNTWRNSHKATN